MNKLMLLIALFVVSPLASAVVDTPPMWPWRGVSMGFPEATKKDLEKYHEVLGINQVRLQLKVRSFAEGRKMTADNALHEALLWADGMLNECARLGIVAVVNMSDFPLDATKGNQTTAEFWDNSESHNAVIDIVRHVVGHFQMRGNELVAYDFMSEPVLIRRRSVNSPGKKWDVLLQKIVNEVGLLDGKRWVVVSPAPYGEAEAYAEFNPPHYSKLIWGLHFYRPHEFTHQGIRKDNFGFAYPGKAKARYWDERAAVIDWNLDALKRQMSSLKLFQDNHPGPVYVGEFSAARWASGGEQYIKDLTSIFDEYGWGWSYFSGTGWHGWNPDYSQNYPGRDKGSNGAWKKDYVGGGSVRWNTLRHIFGVEARKIRQ